VAISSYNYARQEKTGVNLDKCEAFPRSVEIYYFKAIEVKTGIVVEFEQGNSSNDLAPLVNLGSYNCTPPIRGGVRA
jgi:hypothetical protein